MEWELRIKTINIMEVHWKIRLLGGRDSWKKQKIGRIALKGDLSSEQIQ